MSLREKIRNMFNLRAFAGRSLNDDPLQKFKYRVTVAGMPSGAGFSKVSGLSREVDVIKYVEGMYDHVHKLPGHETYGELTLERGSFADRDMEEILKQTLTNASMRQTIMLEICDRFGSVKRTYKLAEAWASKWEGSDLDADSGDVAIEKLTIQFEYFID